MAVALLAPATANAAEQWWFDYEEEFYPVPTDKKSGQPKFFELTLTDKAGKVVLGPCEKEKISLIGEIWNKFGGMGEGEFTKDNSVAHKECPTQNAGKECMVKNVKTVGFGTPWKVTLKASKEVSIANFSLTIELNGKCEVPELPNESTVTGTVEGAFVDFKMEGEKKVAARVTFNKAGPLKVGGLELFLDGNLQFGTEFTARPEPTGFAPTHSPAAMHGKQATTTVITRAARTVSCEEATFTATGKDRDTTLTVTPTYAKCVSGSIPATVKMNGCDYLLDLESDVIEGESYTFTAPTDLKCPAGKEVELEVYSTHANHTAGTVLCRYNLSPAGNEGLELVDLTNKRYGATGEKSWIEAHIDMGGIDSKRTAGTLLLCGAEIHEAGTLKGTMQIVGETDPGGEANGIAVFPE